MVENTYHTHRDIPHMMDDSHPQGRKTRRLHSIEVISGETTALRVKKRYVYIRRKSGKTETKTTDILNLEKYELTKYLSGRTERNICHAYKTYHSH